MNVPVGWKLEKFIDFAPLQRGFDLPASQLVKGSYPVVYSNGIKKYHIDYKVKGPGVVTGRSGTIGKVTLVTEDYWPHNTSLWVTDFKNNLPIFIYYSLINIKLNKYMAGSGVPTLNRNDVHRIKVLVPPLLEQKAIVDILSTWDSAIEKTEKLIEEKEKGFKFLQNDLLKIAHSHKSTTYTPLVDILNYEQPTKYRVKTSDYIADGKVPVLTANKSFILGYTNEQEGIFLKNLPVIIFDDFTTDKKFVNFPFKVKSSAMKILYPKTNNFNCLYVFLTMSEINLPLGGHKRYWLSEYQFIDIPIPSIEFQNEIANIYKLARDEINSLKEILINYKKQKRGMMQKLLTGKWRVKVK